LSETEDWKKEMRELLKPVQKSLGEMSSDLKSLKEGQQSLPLSEGEKADMPLYRCKDGKCAFATDDLDAYIDHKIEHKKAEEKPTEEEKPEPKRHQTVDEFLNCPECRPRFDKRYLKDGWTPPKKEGEKEKKESEGALDF